MLAFLFTNCLSRINSRDHNVTQDRGRDDVYILTVEAITRDSYNHRSAWRSGGKNRSPSVAHCNSPCLYVTQKRYLAKACTPTRGILSLLYGDPVY